MENTSKKQELSLKVENYYQRANGEIVLISLKDKYTFGGTNFYSLDAIGYYKNGKYWGNQSEKDLIREIPKELMTYLKIKIEEFETKPSFRNFVEKVGK